jgi:lincosamide nucleotidyltransferase A/C/D/E
MMVARHSDNLGDWPAPGGSPGAVTGPAHHQLPSMMTSHDVLRVLDGLHIAGVQTVLAGGWGIDALAGRQSRSHRNLNLIVFEHETAAALEALAALGYHFITDTGPVRFLARTNDGRSVELVAVTADRTEIGSDGRRYQHPAGAFNGRGFVVGRPVKCLSAIAQVLAHPYNAGDTDDDIARLHRDRHDLRLLAERSDIAIAAPHAEGPHVTYRMAVPTDFPAMAVVRAAALASIVPHAARIDRSYAYWESRAEMPASWIGVMTLGGAIGATIGIAAPPEPTDANQAVLFALNLSPAFADRHLLDPLLQRSLFAANQLGYRDVRTWLATDAVGDRRFFEQRGWRPDGIKHETPYGQQLHRYARL